MKRYMLSLLSMVGFVLLGLCAGCGGDDKNTNTNPPTNPEDQYEASGTVTTEQESTISTESGAAMRVPRYAVPGSESDSIGTMVFSIERNATAQPAPLTGHTRGSDVYRYGPDGFTFAEMVELTVPVTGDTTGMDIVLNRIDPNTGATEMIGGNYDPATKTISAQRYHLSDYFASLYTANETAWGAFHVTNNSSTHWLKLCVEEYSLAHPEADANFDGNSWCSWAPVNTTGWSNSGNWFLPQGTYTICIEMSRRGTVSTPPGDPQSWTRQETLSQPWSRRTGATKAITISGVSGSAQDGPCDCTPVPSTSVGTGDIQVTLTWHNPSAIDLDLFVIEPNGTQCYYGHTTTASGGTLDRDNKCSNYTNGKPENIFWSSAPAGEYKVQVDWYSACGNSMTSQSYDVRVVAGASVRTYSGTITSNQTVDVATFTMAAGFTGAMGTYGDDPIGTTFSEYLGTTAITGHRPAKE